MTTNTNYLGVNNDPNGYLAQLNTNTPSLANSDFSFPSLQQRTLQGRSGTSLAKGEIDPAMSGISPEGNTPFFNGDSLASNIGTGMNLVGSGLSLANMYQNLTQGREAFKLNRNNMQEQMKQRREAYERSIARQDRTSAAIAEANRRASLVEQG